MSASMLRQALDKACRERDAYRLLTSIALEKLHNATVKLKRTEDSMPSLRPNASSLPHLFRRGNRHVHFCLCPRPYFLDVFRELLQRQRLR